MSIETVHLDTIGKNMRSMDDAPKDGTPVFLKVDGGLVIGQWVRHRAYKHCWAWMVLPWPGCDFLMTVEPIGWHPIPEDWLK